MRDNFRFCFGPKRMFIFGRNTQTIFGRSLLPITVIVNHCQNEPASDQKMLVFHAVQCSDVRHNSWTPSSRQHRRPTLVQPCTQWNNIHYGSNIKISLILRTYLGPISITILFLCLIALALEIKPAQSVASLLSVVTWWITKGWRFFLTGYSALTSYCILILLTAQSEVWTTHKNPLQLAAEGSLLGTWWNPE